MRSNLFSGCIVPSLCFYMTLVFVPQLSGQTIVNYDPIGEQDNSVPLPATSADIGITGGDLIWTGTQGFFNSDVYPIGTVTSSSTIDTNQYIAFTVTGQAEYDTVQHDSRSFGNGPANAAIRSSVDGFANNLDELSGLPPNGETSNIFDVSSLGTQNGPVEFRIYYWNSNNGFEDIVSTNSGGTGLTVRGPAIFDSGVTSANDDVCVFTDADVSQRVAAPFSVATDQLVTGVEFFGTYSFVAPPAFDEFVIEFRADDGGAPAGGDPLASFTVFPNRTEVFTNEFRIRTNSLNFPAKGNTDYWISIRDINPNGATFCLAAQSGAGVSALSFNGGETWVSDDERISFRLFGDDLPPPSNDNWNTGVIGIFDDDFPVTVTGYNLMATTEDDEQQLDNTGSTVWWFVDAPENGFMTVDTFGSDYDTQLHIFSGFANGFENLVPEANNDDANGTFQSQVTFPVDAGECFEIRVGGFRSTGQTGPGDEGCIVLNIAFEAGDFILGDVNCDGSVNLLDVAPFVDRISTGTNDPKADINEDGTVNLLDVGPFVALLSGG